jgi:DNA-binding MarR family transcriptional regulator
VGKQTDIAEQITSNCLMGRTRYLSRVLTGIYDEEVRPFGVQATQVTLLATVKVYGPVRRSDLGRWLHFDSSTLTRNLRVMLDNKWLEEVLGGKDGRGLPLQATEAGAELLRAIGPGWHRAQERAANEAAVSLPCAAGGGRTCARIGSADQIGSARQNTRQTSLSEPLADGVSGQ